MTGSHTNAVENHDVRLVKYSQGENGITFASLSLLCLKIYRLFLTELPKIFTHYSYFIPIVPPIIIIPFLFSCVNDNITMQEWQYIICTVTDCLNRTFDCSIRVSWSFANYVAMWQGTGSIWEGLSPARHAFGHSTVWNLCISCFTCLSYFSFRLFLFLCLCTAYSSGIILAKIVTYYS